MSIVIRNATLVNEGRAQRATVVVDGDTITDVCYSAPVSGGTTCHPDGSCECGHCTQMEIISGDTPVIDAEGKLLLPGVIDTHVHFRQPGYEQKGTIRSESRAAAAGGVTSFCDMPNTNPPTTDFESLNKKFQIAAQDSSVNYSFYLGAMPTNTELFSQIKTLPYKPCGVKLFMGASTGMQATDDDLALNRIFACAAEQDILLMVHCEDASIIERHSSLMESDMPLLSMHAAIRSREACIASTKQAIALAEQYGTRLHIAHISTAEELDLIANATRVTAEVCVGYLLWDKVSGATLGAKLKCNPALKEPSDRNALVRAALEGTIATIATDHAPHRLSDKQGSYSEMASGTPHIQFSLVAMLDLLPPTVAVEKMCHAPAQLYGFAQRGFVRKGYKADLTLVEKTDWQVTQADVLSEVGWSPYEGHAFHHRVEMTMVNGQIVYENGRINEDIRGEAL